MDWWYTDEIYLKHETMTYGVSYHSLFLDSYLHAFVVVLLDYVLYILYTVMHSL